MADETSKMNSYKINQNLRKVFLIIFVLIPILESGSAFALTETIIAEFAGNGPSKLRPLHIEGPWLAQWKADSSISMHARYEITEKEMREILKELPTVDDFEKSIATIAADRDVEFLDIEEKRLESSALGPIGGGQGTTYVDRGGKFKIRISSLWPTAWSLTIVQVAEPVSPPQYAEKIVTTVHGKGTQRTGPFILTNEWEYQWEATSACNFSIFGKLHPLPPMPPSKLSVRALQTMNEEDWGEKARRRK